MIKELVKLHFESQSELYRVNTIKCENTNIIVNEHINDEYWNLAYIKNNNIDIEKEWKNIKQIMSNYNKSPILYVTSDLNIPEKEIENSKLKKKYTDVWMVYENIENFPIYEANVDLKVFRVDENLEKNFIDTVFAGFSRDEGDQYGKLEDGYRKQLEYCFKNSNSKQMGIKHYLGKVGEKYVSTATAIYKDDYAIIYNVTTIREFQKNNICKRMMTMIANDLKNRNVKTICVQTEEGFYPEQVYKKLGFKEIIKGHAYIE